MSRFVLSQTSVVSALDDLANQKEITVFVGAGSSEQAGLPTWNTLVEHLLVRVGSLQGLSDDDAIEFADWTIKSEGLMGSAAIAEDALGPDFELELGKALYGERKKLVPGEIADAVARLWVNCADSDLEIVTTNYDLTLEDALKFELKKHPKLKGLSPVSLHDGRPAPDDKLVVRHLHGVLPPTGKKIGEVILTEGSYQQMQNSPCWQEEYFSKRLQTSSCLFVGTSLSDPNILRYLYRAKGDLGRKHYAVFVRQQDAEMYVELDENICDVREDMSSKRWENIGVSPIRLDYFAESAQFLHELALKKKNPSAAPFEERMEFLDGLRTRYEFSEAIEVFVPNQDQKQELLARIVDAISSELQEEGCPLGRGERLGCSLWRYDSARNQLINWFSSDRSWRNPSTLEPVEIKWHSDFVSVIAFCKGSWTSYSSAQQSATRWNHIIGLPLFSDGEELGRLPLGVITIGSTESESHSALARGTSILAPYIRTLMPICSEPLGAERKI